MPLTLSSRESGMFCKIRLIGNLSFVPAVKPTVNRRTRKKAARTFSSRVCFALDSTNENLDEGPPRRKPGLSPRNRSSLQPSLSNQKFCRSKDCESSQTTLEGSYEGLIQRRKSFQSFASPEQENAMSTSDGGARADFSTREYLTDKLFLGLRVSVCSAIIAVVASFSGAQVANARHQVPPDPQVTSAISVRNDATADLQLRRDAPVASLSTCISYSFTHPRECLKNAADWALYRMDVAMERHPSLAIWLLVGVTASWVVLGGVCWWLLSVFGYKRTALGRPTTLGNCIWASWSCVAAASTHTKENTRYGRGLAWTLTIGGLLSYSILTGAVSARMKLKFDRLASGRDMRAVLETGHVVIAGRNAHLGPLLRQLDKARMYARQDGRAFGRQTVILLQDSCNDAAGDTQDEYTLLGKDGNHTELDKQLPQLNLLLRHGSISRTDSYLRSSARTAEKVVLLANSEDDYDADAQALSSLLALQPAISAKAVKKEPTFAPFRTKETERLPDVVVEVSKASSGNLLHSLGGDQSESVENMSNRILAQCMRQSGLAKVYCKLMRAPLRPSHAPPGRSLTKVYRADAVRPSVPPTPAREEVSQRHTGTIINIRTYPELEGLTVRMLRSGFSEGLFCGLIRNGQVDFHPHPQERLQAEDRFMIIAPKHTHRAAPAMLCTLAERVRAGDTEAEAEAAQMHRTKARANPEWHFNHWADAGAKTAAAQARETAKAVRHFRSNYDAERMLMCGWRNGVADTCIELDKVVAPGTEIVILAQTPIADRETIISRKLRSYGAQPPIADRETIISRKLRSYGLTKLENLRVIHMVGNPLSRTDVLQSMTDPEGGSTRLNKKPTKVTHIVVVADRGWQAGPATDKRSVFATLLAEDVSASLGFKAKSIVAEVVDRRLGQQVRKSHLDFGYISSSELMALYLSQ
ncbi:hypothetical protein CYMTET_51907, partial [Cymbomonas tetramitiformis]